MTVALTPLRSPPVPAPASAAQPAPPPDAAVAPPAGAPPAGAAARNGPNPSLRVEPSLGIVVFEVRDTAGEVVRSVPTERELRDYRAAALRGAPEPQTLNPPGGNSAATSLAPPPPNPGSAAPPAPPEASPARATR